MLNIVKILQRTQIVTTFNIYYCITEHSRPTAQPTTTRPAIMMPELTAALCVIVPSVTIKHANATHILRPIQSHVGRASGPARGISRHTQRTHCRNYALYTTLLVISD